MNITVLIENTAPDGAGLVAEHGLSFWIEAGEQTILLDAGASGRFADNAALLGIDLDRADFAVLSHGHRDHANGLGRFFAANAHAPVYLRSSAPGPLYAKKPEGCVFVLGDNRNRSNDSRDADIGMVDTRYIIGRALIRVFPLSEFGLVD